MEWVAPFCHDNRLAVTYLLSVSLCDQLFNIVGRRVVPLCSLGKDTLSLWSSTVIQADFFTLNDMLLSLIQGSGEFLTAAVQ